ncbi:MAG TPA: hypothetical protein VKU00_34265 [Chthonomonadaceae bacterium]|nr:hypothetical protein [Chthonomonadaceae bacterium]
MILIILISTLLQIPGMFWGEVIDDHDLIHSTVERGCGDNPADCFKHPVFEIYYRPMLGVSFSIGVQVHRLLFGHIKALKPFDMDAFGCHLENFALNACDIALAIWLFRLLLRRDLPALLAGLVFALHPLHVGVTTFIGGRTDTMALFFLFWYAIGLMKTVEKKSALWFGVSLLGFTGAIFTKEQSATMILLAPLLIAIAAQGTSGKIAWRSWASRWWLAIYLIPIALFAWASQHVMPLSKVPKADWTTALHIEMVGRTLWYFVRTLCLPMSAQLHQSTLGPWDTPQPLVMALGYFMAGVWVAILIRVWPDRGLRFLALWLGLTLLPCLNLLPIPSQFASPYRAVIPLFGFAGLVGMALSCVDAWEERLAGIGWRKLPNGVLQFALVAAIVLYFGWQTVTDVPAWRTDTTLMVAETSGDPNFLPAWGGLANGYRYHEKIDKALPLYDLCLERLLPNAHTIKERLDMVYTPATDRRMKSQAGLRYEATGYAQMLTRTRGGALHEMGRYDSAIDDYLVALTINPQDSEVRAALAACYRATGRRAEAWAAENNLLTLPPDEEEAGSEKSGRK